MFRNFSSRKKIYRWLLLAVPSSGLVSIQARAGASVTDLPFFFFLFLFLFVLEMKEFSRRNGSLRQDLAIIMQKNY